MSIVSEAPRRKEPDENMADIVITAAENGKTLLLHVGDTVALRLSEKSTAGYQWTLEQIAADKVTYTKLHESVTPHLLGSEHICIFQFTARATGTTHIQLKHWRAWTGNSSIIARYAVIFDIRS
jgi:predicted secreted protein